MKTLLILFWVFTLIVCWFASTTTIVNGEHNATAFKIKTIFYWVSIILTLFVGHYLI